MHQGTALNTGEDRHIDLFFQIGTAEDHAASRSAQRLVGRGRHDIGVRERTRINSGGNEPRIVRHIDHQVSADFLRNFAETLEVNM